MDGFSNAIVFRKLAEMQKHVEQLERQLGYKAPLQTGTDAISENSQSPPAPHSGPIVYTPVSTSGDTLALAEEQRIERLPRTEACRTDGFIRRTPPAPDRPTLPRTLDGLQVDPGTIEEVFKL